ncbi:hypothetical protein G6F56_002476 [Rhizopus delemar]|nr:hypothetical protein G6F56_002476 [Rhizopus delemar]
MENRIISEIEQLNQKPISEDLLFYVTIQAYSAVPKYRLNHDTNSAIFSASDRLCSQLPSLSSFITLIVNRARVKAGTLLGSLVFLTKMTKKLPTTARGMPCTSYRIFLACLIVSSKTFNDVSPKNSYWCRQAIYFTLGEINLMEKQLLILLEYRTWIKPIEFINTYNDFHLFDLHMLIRQASCVSAIKQHYMNQDHIYSKPSASTLGYSDDSLNQTEDSSEEDYMKTCQGSLLSLKELSDTCEMGKEHMITIIDENFNMESMISSNQQQQQQ